MTHTFPTVTTLTPAALRERFARAVMVLATYIARVFTIVLEALRAVFCCAASVKLFRARCAARSRRHAVRPPARGYWAKHCHCDACDPPLAWAVPVGSSR